MSANNVASVFDPVSNSTRFAGNLVTITGAGVSIVYTTTQPWSFIGLDFSTPQGVVGLLARYKYKGKKRVSKEGSKPPQPTLYYSIISALLLFCCIVYFTRQFYIVAKCLIGNTQAVKNSRSRVFRVSIYLIVLLLCLIETLTYTACFFSLYHIASYTLPTATTMEIYGFCYSLASLITCIMNSYNVCELVVKQQPITTKSKIIFKTILYAFVLIVWFFFGAPYALEFLMTAPNISQQPFSQAVNFYFAVDIYLYW